MHMTKLTAQSLPRIWREILASVDKQWASQLRKAEPRIGPYGPRILILRFKSCDQAATAFCKDASRVAWLESLLRKKTGWQRHYVSIRGDSSEFAGSSTPAYENEGINNGAVGPTPTELHDDLRFRSPHEVSIYDELKRRRVLFFPNAAAVFGGGSSPKREPDFLVFNEAGKCGILEVMGAKCHSNPGKDRQRARAFQRCGIRCVQFFDAQTCLDEPAAVVDEFLAMLDVL